MDVDKSRGFRLMPHGGIILIPIVFATLGLFAALAEDGCDFARIRGASVQMLTGSSIVPFIDSGMSAYRIPDYYPAEKSWRVVYTDACRSYQHVDVLVDAPWRAAKWLRFLASVLGGTATLFLWTSTCLILQPAYWRTAGGCIALACIFQSASFVWFYTKICHTTATSYQDFEAGIEVKLNPRVQIPSSCSLFFGSKCDIASCLLWGLASVFVLLRYPSPIPKLMVQDEDMVMILAPGQNSSYGGHGRRRKGEDDEQKSTINLEMLMASISAEKTSSSSQRSVSSHFLRPSIDSVPRASTRMSTSRQSFTSTYSDMTFA